VGLDKGCGLTYSELKQINQFFVEVEDEGHPYAFMRKSSHSFIADTGDGKGNLTKVTARIGNKPVSTENIDPKVKCASSPDIALKDHDEEEDLADPKGMKASQGRRGRRLLTRSEVVAAVNAT
jgi:hypothetical protein